MIKKLILITSLCISAVAGYAQKKLTPVSKSMVTGIGLPNGSRQDSRILSVAAAATLLEMESDKTNTTLQTTEVLVLPPASLYSFTKDSLTHRLSSQNWKIVDTKGDNYLWLQKGNRFVIAYLSITSRETGIYFAETTSTPTLSSQSTTATTTQTTPVVVRQPVTQTIPSVEEKKDNTISQSTPQETKTKPVNNPPVKSGFTFNTTNFNDGWTSTEQADWIQVTKSNLKVLIHYPNKSADAYNSVLLDGLKNAWNILVAPRYSSATNFEFKPITGWQSIEFAEADAVETTGKAVHVVLFKMNYSNGSGKYIEFITPDKKTYEQEFGPYRQESYGWEKVENMANYNKFAVGSSDLTGKWTSDFSGMIQYVNAYTGADAGANAHSSNQSFEFMADNTYKWEIGVASGMVGNMKFQSAKSAGKFLLPNNWQINFSDLEGKPKTYNVYFSCVKGARLLWLEDSSYATGYTAYGKKE